MNFLLIFKVYHRLSVFSDKLLDEISAPPVDVSSPVKGWRRNVGQTPAGANTQSPQATSPTAAFLPSGFLLNGRYEIQEQLGEGGFGTVYLAIDRQSRERCVVKANRDASPGAAQQFAAEARILRGLRHPNLVQVYEYFEIPGQGQYIVMEFIPGDNLHILSKRAMGPLPQAQALAWVAQICDALDYLHRQNPPVIHRDIKPANIIIGANGQPRLVDFGIAKAAAPGSGTMTGARAHTPGFSPPEQYGAASTDARSDIYALGATLYALLTGKMPPESVARMSGKSLPLMQDLNRAVSQHVQMAVYRAMNLDAGQRFQSAAEFKAALYPSWTGNVYVPPVVRPPVPSRRTGLVITLLGVAGLAGLVCVSAAAMMLFKWPPAAISAPTPGRTAISSITTAPSTPDLPDPVDTEPPGPVATTAVLPTAVPPTQAPPANSSASQRIVYAVGGEQSAKRSIYIKYLDGSKADTRITAGTDQYGDNFPTFSPDGNSIAFSRCYIRRSDGCDLFVKSLVGGNAQRVLSGHKVMRPKWCISSSSSYRDWVVFEDRRKNGNDYQDTESSLGLVNVATGEFKKLTSGISDWHPNWRPDCSQIIFTRYDDKDTAGLNADLMLFDLSTANVSSLTGSASFSPPAELSANWSPDGQWIAYRTADDTNGDGVYNGGKDRNDLWLVHPDGSGAHAIIANSYNIASIAWSPDSQSIVFVTQENRMLICDLQGQIISDFGETYLHADWAP